MVVRDPLDEEMIEELRSILSDDGLAELVELYLVEAPRGLADLQRALAAGDVDGLRTAAHRLKGAAAGVGAQVVAELTRDLERAAQAGGLPRDLTALVAAVESADAALRGALRR